MSWIRHLFPDLVKTSCLVERHCDLFKTSWRSLKDACVRWDYSIFTVELQSYSLQNCKKSFSTRFNRNKHERLKNHWLQTNDKNEIPCFNNVFHCPANGCVTKIVKHLKMCTDLKLKRNTVANNKICPVCSKVFAQKSNCDRHVTIVHSQALAGDIAFDEFDNQHDKQEQNQTKPSMVTSIETVPSEVPQSFPTEVFTNRPE